MWISIGYDCAGKHTVKMAQIWWNMTCINDSNVHTTLSRRKDERHTEMEPVVRSGLVNRWEKVSEREKEITKRKYSFYSILKRLKLYLIVKFREMGMNFTRKSKFRRNSTSNMRLQTKWKTQYGLEKLIASMLICHKSKVTRVINENLDKLPCNEIIAQENGRSGKYAQAFAFQFNTISLDSIW